MPTWVNDDGLVVKTGYVEAELGNAAGYNSDGRLRLTEVVFNYEDMPAVADGQVILNDNVTIPAGAIIEVVKIVEPSVDFDSGTDSATWNLGLIDADDRVSNGVTGALIVDATQAEMNAGGENVAGWVGSAVGTALTQSKLLTWEVNTEAATAGLTTVELYWYIPKNETDTLVYTKS